ncbi:MAG: ABC transporter permease [Vagococcus sp.]|nr:ABC transporter permease [Vagococcus sp.]
MSDTRDTQTQEDLSTRDWLSTVLHDTESNNIDYVATWSLQRIGTRLPLKQYLHSLWKYRMFIVFQSRAKAFSSARNTGLGRVWLVLEPFLSAGVFYVIFGLLLQTSRGIDNFIGYLVVGISFFTYMQNSLTRGGTVIQQNKNIIRSFAFPRATLIIADIMMRLIDTFPLMLATMMFIIIMPPHVIPSFTWLLIIPVHLLMVLFSTGLMFIVAKLTVLIKDLRHIWPLLGRFWFYSSGVFFSIDNFASHPTIVTIMNLNPGYVILQMYRDVLIYNRIPYVSNWLYVFGWAAMMLIFGFLFFWYSEEKYGQANI